MDIFINELQAVPVAGNHHTLPAIVAANAAHGADHIIGLPALAGINGNIHGLQHLHHHRHLLCQFFRHSVACCFVTIVLQVTECGAVDVKGNTHRFWLLLLLHPLQNVQKSENGIGVKPLPGGKGLDSKKGTIYDGVSVKDHKLHTFLHLAP